MQLSAIYQLYTSIVVVIFVCVEEIRVLGDIHHIAPSHWQMLFHIRLYQVHLPMQGRELNSARPDCIGRCKSNYIVQCDHEHNDPLCVAWVDVNYWIECIGRPIKL